MLHVDHENLVLASSGLERNKKRPRNLRRAKVLEPGSRTLDLTWGSLVSPEQISPQTMTDVAESWTGKHVASLLIAMVADADADEEDDD